MAWGALLFVILGVTLAGLIIQLKANCFHATDFSIYQEAIYKIAKFGDFNPYLYVRQVKIFNDHFDPVIILAAFFVKIFGYHASNLILFEFLWFLGIFGFIWSRKEVKLSEKLFFSTIVLFTKGILSGLNFPIHPTTWSMLPIFLLPFLLHRNKSWEIITISLTLCTFKESFPFSVLMLGIYFSLRKDLKKAVPLLAIAIGFLVFNFYFRKILFGPTMNYGGNLLKPIFLNPLTGIWDIFVRLDYKSFFKAFYPFFIPIFLILRPYLKRDQWEELLKDQALCGTIFLYLPIFAIQLIANNVHHQYGAQLTAPLLGIILFKRNILFENKRFATITVLLFIASGMGSITKNFRATFSPKQRFCIIGPEKSELNHQLKATLLKQPKNFDVLATGGVIPMLMEPERKFYQAGYFSEKRKDHALLILERNGSGKTFPLTREFIEEIIPLCESEAEEILIKNKFFFMIKKPSVQCLERIHQKWIAG